MPSNYAFRSLVWHVTNACNIKCVYCSTLSHPKANNGLPTEVMLLIAKSISEHKQIKHISITGGEPLLREDLPLILNSLPDEISINLDTNGILIRKKWAAEFEKLHHISISLDGPMHINDKFRSNYEKIINNIDWLIAKGMSVGSTITVGHHNLDTLVSHVDKLIDCGISIIGINRLESIGRNISGKYSLGNTDLVGFLYAVKEKCKKHNVILMQSGWYPPVILEDDNRPLTS